MHKHTRATPAGVPRGRSFFTRGERKKLGHIRGGFARRMRVAEWVFAGVVEPRFTARKLADRF